MNETQGERSTPLPTQFDGRHFKRVVNIIRCRPINGRHFVLSRHERKHGRDNHPTLISPSRSRKQFAQHVNRALTIFYRLSVAVRPTSQRLSFVIYVCVVNSIITLDARFFFLSFCFRFRSYPIFRSKFALASHSRKQVWSTWIFNTAGRVFLFFFTLFFSLGNAVLKLHTHFHWVYYMFAIVIVYHFLCSSMTFDCQKIKELLTYLLIMCRIVSINVLAFLWKSDLQSKITADRNLSPTSKFVRDIDTSRCKCYDDKSISVSHMG